MVVLPMRADSLERGVLLAHELCIESRQLGLPWQAPPMRIWDSAMDACGLRLEGRALRRAVTLEGERSDRALRDALAFRRVRRALFRGADSTERALELMKDWRSIRDCVSDGVAVMRWELVERRLAALDT